MNAAREILDAIQSEAEFENTEVEQSIIKALEALDKDLVYVQYELSTDVELAVNEMNKVIAKANSDIVEEDDDDDDDDDDILDLDDEDDDIDDDEPLILDEEEDTTEEENEPPTPST